MVDNMVALQVRPLDIATPLMQAAKMRQMEAQQQAFEQDQKRELVGQTAAEIMAAPEHEQQGLWNGKMAQLRAKGAIDDNDFATLTNGYSPLRVQQLVARALPLKDYLTYDLARGGREADAAVGNAAAGVISGRGTPPQGVLPPMSGAPSGGYLNRPPVQSSPTVVGDQEGVDRGIYDASVPMPRPSPFAASPAGGMPPQRPGGVSAPQPTAAPPSSTATSPEMAAIFVKAMTNPKTSEGTRAVAKTFLEGYVKDKELTPEGKNYRDYFADEVAGGRTPKSREEYTLAQKRAGATAITNDMRGENAFSKTFGEVEAKRWGSYITDGEKADRAMVDVTNLREISQRMGSPGATANVKEWLGPYTEALGINVAGLSDIQTFSSVIQRLAPQQRPPGSGSTSDFEFKAYLKALPGLSQTPDAREATLNTMEALTRHDQAQRDIAIKLSTGELTRVEAERAMRALPDPMAGFKAWRVANPALYNDALGKPGMRPATRRPAATQDNGPAPAELEAEMRRRGLLK